MAASAVLVWPLQSVTCSTARYALVTAATKLNQVYLVASITHKAVFAEQTIEGAVE
jgi:hypothetical protein